jgi:hypothetical protein
VKEKKSMQDRTVIGTPNQRRANRVPLARPVRLVGLRPVEGQTVNMSATGLLVHLPELRELCRGEKVAVEIPRMDGEASILRHGRIVRVEPQKEGMSVAIDLV